MEEIIENGLRYVLPAIFIIIAVYCVKHLLQSKAPEVTPACLVDSLTGKEYLITNWETSIGRSNACDIVLVYPSVSRFHAVISKHKRGWVLTDTHSSHGTGVRNTLIGKPTVINDGDEISFGGICLQFRVK